MGAPQIIWIVLVTLSVGLHLSKHGEPRTERYSFWGMLLNAAITAGLLYWGGFFNG